MKAKRRAADKMAEYASLAVSCEEAVELAENKRRAAPQQASVLKLLAEIGEADTKEISYFTGANIRTIRSLEKNGYIKIEKREVFRLPKLKKSDKPLIAELNGEQRAAYDGLSELMEKGEAAAALLYGVTGSGKTSVYIKLIQRAIELGGQAIVLVPEIALTPQLMSVFSGYFGQRVALLHSSLSINERYDEWKKIRSGGADVVVGTRSAVFAPLSRLRLLILDEEQEAAYKSENSPRYDAKEIAKFICVQENALLLLGSATPSVESMYNAKLGKYKLFSIKNRYNARALPEVYIADMKENAREGGGVILSRVLMRELEKNIAAGEQTILFINRRGANSSVACPECGYTFECPSCSAKLTYHSANHRLMCHYCGYSQPSEESCPECGTGLDYIGAGTQRIEDELGRLFRAFPSFAWIRIRLRLRVRTRLF
jgi:primosomal protein N' (replication factor Y)